MKALIKIAMLVAMVSFAYAGDKTPATPVKAAPAKTDTAKVAKAAPAKVEAAKVDSTKKDSIDDQCTALTKKGERCKNKCKKGSKFCAMHAKMNGAKADTTKADTEKKPAAKK